MSHSLSDAADAVTHQLSATFLYACLALVGLIPTLLEAQSPQNISRPIGDCPLVTEASVTIQPSQQENNRQPGLRDAMRCLTNMRAIYPAWQAGRYQVIDVRAPKDYAAYHIPGSLNLPDYAIKTKAYLKKKPLLLINTGQNRQTLLQRCAQLHEAGFRQVKVLDQGLYGWLQQGGKFAVRTPLLKEINRITAQSLPGLLKDRDWTLITSMGAKKELGEQLSGYPIIEYQGDSTKLRRRLERPTDHSMITPGYLVITPTTADKYRIAQALQGTNQGHVLYLEGGIQALKDQQRLHRLQLAKLVRGPNRPKGCSI